MSKPCTCNKLIPNDFKIRRLELASSFNIDKFKFCPYCGASITPKSYETSINNYHRKEKERTGIKYEPSIPRKSFYI